MDIPQIRLSQVYAVIGLNIEKPIQTIQQPQARMEIQQVPSRLEVQQTKSLVMIDQTQAWNEMNLKNPFTLTRDLVRESYGQLLEGISKRVSEGNRLAAIEYKGNPIADIAKQNSNSGLPNINVTFIPSYGAVKIDFSPSDIRVNVEQGGTIINAEVQRPKHEYRPGKVEVYLKQKENLVIDFTGLEVDLTL